jgi:hypothetical protein
MPTLGRGDEGYIDAEPDILLAEALSAICVQRLDDSRNSAIHTTYRISLRSSSLREPRYPLLRVVLVRCVGRPSRLHDCFRLFGLVLVKYWGLGRPDNQSGEHACMLDTRDRPTCHVQCCHCTQHQALCERKPGADIYIWFTWCVCGC